MLPAGRNTDPRNPDRAAARIPPENPRHFGRHGTDRTRRNQRHPGAAPETGDRELPSQPGEVQAPGSLLSIISRRLYAMAGIHVREAFTEYRDGAFAEEADRASWGVGGHPRTLDILHVVHDPFLDWNVSLAPFRQAGIINPAGSRSSPGPSRRGTGNGRPRPATPAGPRNGG